MVRLRAEAQLGGNSTLPELERHLEIHKEKLKTYQQIFAKDFAQADENDRTLYIHKMILQLGIDQELGWIAWLEQVIPRLKQFDVEKL
jgi:Virulence activator alpha C-term.